MNLPWDAKGNVDFVPTKIKGQNVDALTFGSGLYYQRASWMGPNLFNNGQIQRSIPSKLSFLNCFWTLNDDSTAACPNAPLTLAMGQDDFLDRNGNLLAGLVYGYTNDGSADVDLSNFFSRPRARSLRWKTWVWPERLCSIRKYCWMAIQCQCSSTMTSPLAPRFNFYSRIPQTLTT